jgi:hypothetical protein
MKLVKLQLQHASYRRHSNQNQRENPSSIWRAENIPSGKEIPADWTHGPVWMLYAKRKGEAGDGTSNQTAVKPKWLLGVQWAKHILASNKTQEQQQHYY